MKIRWLLLFACLNLPAAEPQKSTRAFHNFEGVGVSGYIHRPATAAKVRVVLQPTLRKQPASIDWSKDGVGWDVEVHTGIPISHPCELIPLSVHEYKLKAVKSEPKWPIYDLLAPTRVFRRTGDQWDVVAESGRRFVWKEGFVLKDGDVITVREVDPY
jgi:hypothetical protein